MAVPVISIHSGSRVAPEFYLTARSLDVGRIIHHPLCLRLVSGEEKQRQAQSFEMYQVPVIGFVTVGPCQEY